MKNQYFGDEIDYLKYGILRTLCRQPDAPRVHCAWMLTAPDERSDGQRIGYLDDPGRWRDHDPELFDTLAGLVRAGKRDVGQVTEANIVPGAHLHEALVADDVAGRRAWFEALHHRLAATDLVFFDPDNGLEIASCKRGRRGSSKFLFLDEVSAIFGAGCSQLIFQHFPRVARDPYIARRAAQLSEACGGVRPAVLKTSRVAWFLLPHPSADLAPLATLADKVGARWGPAITPAAGWSRPGFP